MIITIASFKGGVGKTSTAIHLAGYLQKKAPTLLIDGDPNRSATGWSKRGSLPFAVTDEDEASVLVKEYAHIVIDTQARPSQEDLQSLAAGCDFLVIPTTPDVLALEALMLMRELLTKDVRYKVLLTIVPPKPSKDGEECRIMLKKAGLPTFRTSVRRLSAFPKAALSGVLVNQIRDSRAQLGWDDYQNVGKELLK